jgi:hypothetical protein
MALALPRQPQNHVAVDAEEPWEPPPLTRTELRGFKPLTSAVQAPACLTGSSLPFLDGSSATSALCATTRSSCNSRRGQRGSRIDGRGTAVCLSQLNARPVAAQTCTRLGRLPRLSHRRLISLQVDVVGHVLVNGLIPVLVEADSRGGIPESAEF